MNLDNFNEYMEGMGSVVVNLQLGVEILLSPKYFSKPLCSPCIGPTVAGTLRQFQGTSLLVWAAKWPQPPLLFKCLFFISVLDHKLSTKMSFLAMTKGMFCFDPEQTILPLRILYDLIARYWCMSIPSHKALLRK